MDKVLPFLVFHFSFIDIYLYFVIFYLVLYPQGVYQIGLVYARSWVDTGAPFGIGTPNRNASIVVQRGVGISITRA
jgi:hypothetical protein